MNKKCYWLFYHLSYFIFVTEGFKGKQLKTENVQNQKHGINKESR